MDGLVDRSSTLLTSTNYKTEKHMWLKRTHMLFCCYSEYKSMYTVLSVFASNLVGEMSVSSSSPRTFI